MDFTAFSTALQSALGAQLPGILGAVGVLVVSYIIAVIARAAVRKLLSLAKLNVLLNQSVGKPMNIEGGHRNRRVLVCVTDHHYWSLQYTESGADFRPFLYHDVAGDGLFT